MSVAPRDPAACTEGRTNDEAHEWAALAAVGALPADEASQFEEHVAVCRGCSTLYRQHLDDVGSFAETLGDGAPAPSASLKSKLLTRARSNVTKDAETEDVQVWKQWSAAPGLEIANGILAVPAAVDWEEIPGAPGVSVRRLLVDAQKRTTTMMVRMEAGCRYPSHRHHAREECFVLAGDLRFDDEVFHTGDFLYCEPGSVHAEQWTKDGCELLIVSSLDDELLV